MVIAETVKTKKILSTTGLRAHVEMEASAGVDTKFYAAIYQILTDFTGGIIVVLIAAIVIVVIIV